MAYKALEQSVSLMKDDINQKSSNIAVSLKNSQCNTSSLNDDR